MTYVVLEWNYDEVNSIIEKLSNACAELRKTPALSASDTGSEHDATLSKHVTALNSTLNHMAWILNGIYLGLAAATTTHTTTTTQALFQRGTRRSQPSPPPQADSVHETQHVTVHF